MAGGLIPLYRNYDSSDGTMYKGYSTDQPLPDAATLGWSKAGYVMAEWNSNRDGTGNSYAIGIPPTGTVGQALYAIWQEDVTIPYIATNKELKSIANAIRAKGGTSAQLSFPTEFVSAIQAIQTGITPTGTKQITITANGTTTEDVTNYANAQITVAVADGGNGRYEVGDITIPSEVLVTATPAPFPGLELDFDPDYIQVWFDKDDFNAITSSQNGRMYLIVGIKHDSNFIPVRPSAGRPYIADELSTNGYYFLAGTNMIAASSPDTGYGLAGWAGSIWATAYPGWEIDDGKFYIRRLAAGNQKIPPGTYHYVAYKRGV